MLIILAFQAMQGHTIKVTWQVRLNTPMWVKGFLFFLTLELMMKGHHPTPTKKLRGGGGGDGLKRVIYWNKVHLHEKIKSEV